MKKEWKMIARADFIAELIDDEIDEQPELQATETETLSREDILERDFFAQGDCMDAAARRRQELLPD